MGNQANLFDLDRSEQARIRPTGNSSHDTNVNNMSNVKKLNNKKHLYESDNFVYSYHLFLLQPITTQTLIFKT